MTAPDPSLFFQNIHQEDEVVWTTPSIAEVSYPSDSHESLASLEEHSFWFQHRRNLVLEFMKQYGASTPLLDIGAGNGYMSIELQKAGYPAISIEPGPDGVACAKRRGVRSIVHSDFGNLEIRKGSFPSVGLFDVLEHVEDDLGFLRKLHDSLIESGKIFLTVPAHPFLFSDADTHAGHFRRYTRKTLREVLENSGFEVEFIAYFFFLLVPPLFLTRTLATWFKKSKPFSDNRNRSEHMVSNGLSRKIVSLVFAIEHFLMKHHVQLPMGTSCIAVAKKR